MRTAAVVVADPVVDDLLSDLQARERWQGGQQLSPQRLVEPLHLAGRGRAAHAGEAVGDGVLAADPIEQHLSGARPAEAAGELAAIVGQDLGRHPIAGQGGGEGGTDRSAGGPRNQGGNHPEPGVIVKAGDQLALGPVSQADPAHDVELPQLHRPIPLPAPPLAPPAAPAARLDEVVADQDAVDPGPRRHPTNAAPPELMLESQRSPAGMLATQLTDRCFGLDRGLMGTGPRTMGAILQPGQTSV
jgi:hypothetical protein